MTAPWAQNTISDTLLNAGRDNNITNAYNHYGNNVVVAPDPLARLQKLTAFGALHDAAERPDPPKCHENTRIAILGRVDRWARDQSADAKPILWLSGAAGAGKSAIAQTLIERWRKDRLAVPNFFFWRTAAKRNQKTHIVATIAFQLTKLLPATKPIIEDAVRDGSFFHRNLQAQVEALIVDPLQATRNPVIIVLDALDECCVNIPRAEGFPGQHYEDQQREILEAIAFTCQNVPFLRVLIASRPEYQIRTSFADKLLFPLSLPLSLNNERDAKADITLYLNCTFAEIRSNHPGIDPSWPSKEQIEQLVEKSSEQFIYPSTVIKYVSRPRRHPIISLEEVLAIRTRSDKQGGHPLAELDALYTLVLKMVTEDSLPTVMLLLGLMSYYPDLEKYPHPFMIFHQVKRGFNNICLEKFFFLLDGELSTHLTDLHSILSITVKPNIAEIGFFHATLSEYLQDETRSGEFFICKSDLILRIALLLLRHACVRQTSKADDCDLSRLYGCLAIYANGSPPSVDLMKGLWSLLKDDLGEYSEVSGSNPTLGRVSATHVGEQPKYFQGEISPHLHSGDRCSLLSYLQKCNIPQLEPSNARRQAVGIHLLYLRKLADPVGKYNHWFPTEDTRDSEDTEISVISASEFNDAKKFREKPSPLPSREDGLKPPARVHVTKTRKRRAMSNDAIPGAELVVSSHSASLPTRKTKRERRKK